MWREGYHTKDMARYTPILKQIEGIKGEIDTEQAQVLFAKYCYANPAFAVELLTGFKIYEFQDLMIRAMLKKDFFLGICSRALGKTTMAGWYVPLYAILNPGVKIGITSRTFRQSRAIFEKIEEMAANPGGHFLNQCITKTSKKTDGFSMRIGAPGGIQSEIIALPLGEQIRGYRFHLMIIDELLLLNEKIVNEVIKPFLAGGFDPRESQKLREAEDALIAAGKLEEWQRTPDQRNKLIGLSSATYKFEYLYRLYDSYRDLIFDEDAEDVNHGIMQLSYYMAPKGLYDEKIVEEGRATMTSAQFDREYGAQFTDESSGYFNPAKMEAVSLQDGEKPTVKIKGDPAKKYILGIDPNYEDSESSDHFAMCLLELDEDKKCTTMVHGYALAKSNIKKRAAYLNYLFGNFNIVYVAVDRAGGKSLINDYKELKLLKKEIDFFEADYEDEESIHIAQADYNLSAGKIVHAQQFSTGWIREANEYLQMCVDREKVFFGAPIEPNNCAKEGVDVGPLEFSPEDSKYKRGDKKLKLADFIEHQSFMNRLTKRECAFIEITTTATGTQRFDLPKSLRNDRSPSKARKDSYTALLLANWGAKCYMELMGTAPAKTGVGQFSPFFAVKNNSGSNFNIQSVR